MNSIRVENSICIITLDNKPHNYLESPEFVDAAELKQIIGEQKCLAIIVTGAGRHFSAGADRNNLFKMAKNGSLKMEIEKGKNLFQLLFDFKLPIIACVEGTCFGGGLEIALNADIKIASEKSLFAFPEVNLGVIPGLGGINQTTRIVGKAKAIENVLRGDILNVESAQKLGLIDHIVEAKTSFEQGVKLAKSMTEDRSVEIIQAVIECVRNAESLPYKQAIDRETELFCELARKAARDT